MHFPLNEIVLLFIVGYLFAKDTDNCWITWGTRKKKVFHWKNTFWECWPKQFSNVIGHYWIAKDNSFDSTFCVTMQCGGIANFSFTKDTDDCRITKETEGKKCFTEKNTFWSVDLSDTVVGLVITELLRTINPMALFVPQCNAGVIAHSLRNQKHWITKEPEGKSVLQRHLKFLIH